MARQQQLYQKLREVQESLAQEEENSTTHNQELELLTTKRKTKVLEMTNYLQRKSELLIKRDELLAIDQERGTAASRLKEELEILKV
jgi:transposase-like protein